MAAIRYGRSVGGVKRSFRKNDLSKRTAFSFR
jgi:hypothetical protein